MRKWQEKKKISWWHVAVFVVAIFSASYYIQPILLNLKLPFREYFVRGIIPGQVLDYKVSNNILWAVFKDKNPDLWREVIYLGSFT